MMGLSTTTTIIVVVTFVAATVFGYNLGMNLFN